MQAPARSTHPDEVAADRLRTHGPARRGPCPGVRLRDRRRPRRPPQRGGRGPRARLVAGRGCRDRLLDGRRRRAEPPAPRGARHERRHRHDRLGRVARRGCARSPRRRASASWRRRTSRSASSSSARLVEAAGALLGPQADYGAFLHELHHATKRDAPSGTALSLKRALEASGYPRPIDVAATRAGSIPGTHTIGFDGAVETITLTHTVARSRHVRARRARGRPLGARPPRLVHDERLPRAERRRSTMRRLWTGAGRRWSRRSRAAARSTRPACAGSRGGRSTRAFTSSCRAARRARAPR